MSTPAAQGSSATRSTVNRTEVQSDLLADRIERWFIQIKPMLPWILAAIVVIIVVSVTISLISGQAAKKEATAWQDVYFSQASPAELEATSADFQGTSASLWARQLAADAKLNEALLQIYLDRDIAVQKISEARAEYESVAGSSRDSMLTVRANLGIAKTYDAEGNTEQAVESYGKVLKSEGTDAQLREFVSDRIQFIQSEQGKEFFAWFKENKSTPPRSTGATEDLKNLPTLPDIKFSNPEVDVLKDTGSSTPPTGGDAFKLPDAGITLPTESTPSAGQAEPKANDTNSLELPPETPTEQPASPPENATEQSAAPSAPAQGGDAEAKP
jgi:hypothetical protein